MTQLKNILATTLSLVLIFTLSSCEKTDDLSGTLSESESAELLEASLQSTTGGLTSNVEDLSGELLAAITEGQVCDSLYSETVDKDYQGAIIQANYQSNLSFEIACNNFSIPQEASFSSTTATIFSTNRINSDGNGTFMGTATGLQLSTSSILINGNYRKSSVQALGMNNPKDINSTLSMELSQMSINKQSQSIESGSAKFSFYGTAEGEPFSYEGSIVFNSKQTATLTINGNVYEMDWN